MSKITYLIVGRTATGKDYLADKLCEHGMSKLKSYTTRKRRSDAEDTHIFIEKDDIEKYEEDIVARTEINGNTYFATRELVETCDVYIIDMNGIPELLKAMPYTNFFIIGMEAAPELRKMKFIARGNEDESAWEARNESEDEQFANMQEKIQQLIDENSNLLGANIVQNNFLNSTMDDVVNHILERDIAHKHLSALFEAVRDIDNPRLEFVHQIDRSEYREKQLIEVINNQKLFDNIMVSILCATPLIPDRKN